MRPQAALCRTSTPSVRRTRALPGPVRPAGGVPAGPLGDDGRSVPSAQARSQDELVGWLGELFDGLGLTSPIRLVGLSYGGWLAVRRLASAAPQIRTEIIPGAGHDLPITQAELVNASVIAFLHDDA